MQELHCSRHSPAGSYACEVWGIRRLCGREKQDRDHLQRAHVKLWRRLLQLPDSVASAIVLRELQVLSPAHIWLRSTCRFWTALALRPVGCLWRAVALSDWDDAIARNVKNWAWSVYMHLTDLGYMLHVDRRRLALL